MKKAYDVIIVGAGHNGLVTSAYLARQGLRVLVCEKRSIIGGAACTEEIVKGFKFSRASYLLSLFRQKIIDDLNLHEHGLKYYFRDPVSYTPIKNPINNNQRSLLLSSSNNEFNKKQIAQFSVKDAVNYQYYEEWLTKICRAIDKLIYSLPPDLNQMNQNSKMSDRFRAYNYSLKIFYDLFKKLGFNGSLDLYQLLTSSAGRILDKWFESDIMKATLATDGLIGTMLGPYDSGTGYVLLHHVMGDLGGRANAWYYVQGGMGGISNAIASSARSSGVEIRTDCNVNHIDIRNAKVEGVILENGEEIRGKLVASNATAYVTFKNLILNDVINTNKDLGELKKHILQSDYKSGTTKINLALSGLPNFLANPNKKPNELEPHHQCTIHINSESMSNLQNAYQQALNGQPSQNPLIEMVIPSSLDPTLAPKNCHVALLFTQYTPYRLSNDKQIEITQEYKENYYRSVINSIEQYAPGFEKLIIGRDMLFPSDLEEQFSLTGGNIFHGALSLDQMYSFRPAISCSNHRTPINGLYLCGSSTHPGGGVTGMPGFNAATIMLQDWQHFVTIAAVLGTGVLGLPITLYDSGFGPFIISICIAYFVQVLLILFFTEVLQKVYYHNIEKLKESEQDHMLIQVDTEESPTSESNYDVIADRAHFWDSTVNHKSAIYSKCCLIFGTVFNYFVSILFLAIHLTLSGENFLTIEICRMPTNTFLFMEHNYDEKTSMPTMIACALFILIDLLTFSWIYIAYRDIYNLKRKSLANLFFYSLVFTKFKGSERSLMVNRSLKRLLTVCLFLISNMIATLPILTLKIFNISLNIYLKLFLIYFTTLPWIDFITFFFYNETKLVKTKNVSKKIISNEHYTLQQLIVHSSEALKRCLPNLYSLGKLLLPSFLPYIYTLVVILLTMVFLISYGLAGSQAFATLFNIVYTDVIPAFCWILTFVVFVLHSFIQPIISVLTLIKAILFTMTIIITLIVGSKIQNQPTSDYSATGDSMLMSAMALCGAVNIMPLMFSKLKQTRQQMIGFNVAVVLGLTTCLLLNILWCWSVLEIVPQKSACLPVYPNKTNSIESQLFSGLQVAGECIASPSLQEAALKGEISTIPLSKILESKKYASYKYVSIIIEIFVAISISVSFITVGSILYHTISGVVDSYWDLKMETESKYRGILKYFTKRRILGLGISIICFTIVFVIVFTKPNSFKTVLEQGGTILLSIQIGIFVAMMIYQVSLPNFSSCEIPFSLPKWFFHLQFFIPKIAMQARSPRIGFEGIFSDENIHHIGFEQYETDQQEHAPPAYPLNDTMPIPDSSFRNSFSGFDTSSLVTQTTPSGAKSLQNNDTSRKAKTKSLSYPQLSAIYNEIVNQWCREQWLLFDDDQKETYLTLDFKTRGFFTVQMAIDHFHLTSSTHLLLSQPECLLIRTQKKAKTSFLPNSSISIGNLLQNDISQQTFRYKILAIICESHETNSKLMFYKDKQTHDWYVYYNESISSPSCCNMLSNEEHRQIESFIQQENQLHSNDLSNFAPPLSNLYNHPIVYIYIPDKNNKKH
ncbi:unnamed protein product [Rotaria socialis]|uniref:Amine oxidase domain-containing protein n=1 Tax=Rotaria socialis TaxID=392032 RepID=A0A820G595_9BILA|nr:unnamed protein product [Rotaria socialis]